MYQRPPTGGEDADKEPVSAAAWPEIRSETKKLDVSFRANCASLPALAEKMAWFCPPSVITEPPRRQSAPSAPQPARASLLPTGLSRASLLSLMLRATWSVRPVLRSILML